jgi:hypothetical protein
VGTHCPHYVPCWGPSCPQESPMLLLFLESIHSRGTCPAACPARVAPLPFLDSLYLCHSACSSSPSYQAASTTAWVTDTSSGTGIRLQGRGLSPMQPHCLRSLALPYTSVHLRGPVLTSTVTHLLSEDGIDPIFRIRLDSIWYLALGHCLRLKASNLEPLA